MVCPNCGNNISWRETSCPYCGAANPTQKKETVRKRKRRQKAKPVYLALAAAALLILILILLPKGDKKDNSKPQETKPSVTTATDRNLTEDTTPQVTKDPEPTGEMVLDPAAYSGLDEFAKSETCARIMVQNQQNGTGAPARYAIADLNADGADELLVVSGEREGLYDTLIFTADLNLSAAIASYDFLLFDADEQAIAYQPYAPQGTLEGGGYCAGHSYYKLHAASGALYPLYSIGVDEGVPLKDNGGVTETITLEEWQAAIDKLQSFSWQTIA